MGTNGLINWNIGNIQDTYKEYVFKGVLTIFHWNLHICDHIQWQTKQDYVFNILITAAVIHMSQNVFL